MTQSFIVPLSPVNQTLSVVLNGVTYNLELRWNDPAAAWVLDLYDVDLNPVLTGVALVTGEDLLAQFAYLAPALSGQLFVLSSVDDPLTPPTFTSLGVTDFLYYNSP